MTDRVLLDVRDGIAYVTLNRAQKYNGLDLPMFHGLIETAKRIAADRTPRWAFWTESVLQGRLMTGINHKLARRAGLTRELPKFVGRRLR
jgi:hypothetical protein